MTLGCTFTQSFTAESSGILSQSSCRLGNAKETRHDDMILSKEDMSWENNSQQ
jgi:hypothetical protein